MSTQNLLRGRATECAALDQLLSAARIGESRTVVLRGEAGVGKTALLDYMIGSATDFRVLRSVGVESEMELAFASLHQLCAPILDRRDSLPGPQKEALEVAFGLNSGPPPDRFLVALATLSLLAEIADERPVLCVIDDAQWLDDASALAFAFVARRLLAEPIALVFSVRVPAHVRELAGLPELMIEGLGEEDSHVLLDSALPGRLDDRVRDRLIAEARGNPLALLELPRTLTAAELAGGFNLPPLIPIESQIEQSFWQRIETLPAETRRLLLVAAAEPFGDVSLLWRAASRLGLGPETAAPAEAAGLVRLGALVRFRHPLVRSAIYKAAALPDRQEVHGVLAESLDAEIDPDRRAWHRAQAAPGPDEDVAMELERSADRAQARGGVAATAAFLERAAGLTQDPARRAQRAIDAAQAKLQAGAFEPAAALLAMAESGALDELGRARIDLLRGELAFAQNRGRDAPPLLLSAAHRLEPLDVSLARETYLEALSAAIFAGHLARGQGLQEIAEAARRAPPVPSPRVPDVLLDALAVRFTDGYAASVPIVARAVQAACEETTSDQKALRWLWMASTTPSDLWDDERWYLLASRHVTISREAGALSELPLALNSCVYPLLFAGELASATALVEEARTVSEATGGNLAPYGALALAAWRGREQEARTLIDTAMNEAASRGEGMGVTMTHWANAVLCNGLGQYDDAVLAAQQAAGHQQELTVPRWGLAELVEAASHSGAPELASDALEQLSETTRASGTNWALGIEARSRALLAEGGAVEELHRESIKRLELTRFRAELARSQLLYGEWLRRTNRRVDAREQLRAAHDTFSFIGAEAFAERARRELLATGETARRRVVDLRDSSLTPQEAQIARLARDGHSNPEIGGQLFISPRTVQYHLRKVFTKLEISSRSQLARIPSDRLSLV